MVNFMSLNVNGLRDRFKRQAFLTWLSLQSPSPDIVCLQETHSTSDAELQSWFGGSSYSFLGTHSSNHSAGVCILFKPCFSSFNCHQDQSGRLVVVDFKSVFHDFRVLCVYAPNRYLIREVFFEEMEDFSKYEFTLLFVGRF